MMTRADRNNNPGNLRPGKMMFTGQTGVDDGGFAVFGSPDAGMAAADQNLAHYGSIGVNTPTSIANRWTTTDRPQRIAAIQAATGAGPNDQIDLTDPAVRAKVLNQATYPLEGATMHDAIGDLIDSAIKRNPSADPHGDAIDAAIRRPSAAATNLAPASPEQMQNMRDLNAQATASGKEPPFQRLEETSPEGQTAFDRAAATDGPMGTPAAEQAAAKPPIDTVTGHTVSGDMQAGAAQGAKDTFGGLNEFSSWADRNFAPLNMLDQAASNLVPGVAPNKIQQAVNQYNQQRDDYNAHYDSQYSGFGRALGTIATQTPFLAAGGGALAAGADAGLGSEIANPLVQYLAGRGGSTVATRALSLSTSGAATGAASGALGSAASDNSVGQNMLTGALTGAVAAPVLGRLTGGYQGTGAKLNPIVAGNLAKGAAMDPPVLPAYGTVAPSPVTRTAYTMASAIPGSGVAADSAERSAAVNVNLRRLLGTSRVSSPADYTPDSMGALKNGLSQTYEDIGTRTPIQAVPPSIPGIANDNSSAPNLVSDLDKWAAKAKEDQLPPLHDKIDGFVKQVKDAIGLDGVIPGPLAMKLTRATGPLVRSSDSTVRGLGQDVRGIVNQHLKLNATPEDAAALGETNQSWGLMRALQRHIAKGDGTDITPQSLGGILSTNFKPSYAAFNDIGEAKTLANLGSYMRPERSSQTPQGALALRMMTGGPALALGGIGSMLGYHFGAPPEVIAQALAGAGGAGVVNRILASRLQDNGATNQLIARSLNGNTPGPINYIPQALSAFAGNEINRLAGPQTAQGPRQQIPQRP